MQSKFYNFKNEQKQKYDLSKRYFASDEEMNEEEFLSKRKNFSFRYVKTDRIPVYFCDHLSFVL